MKEEEVEFTQTVKDTLKIHSATEIADHIKVAVPTIERWAEGKQPARFIREQLRKSMEEMNEVF